VAGVSPSNPSHIMEDNAMTPFRMTLATGIVLLLAIGACERQGPPPKPIGSATNRHVEESPATVNTDAMMQNMKTPMDNARQTEDVLRGAADRTRQQSEPTAP